MARETQKAALLLFTLSWMFNTLSSADEMKYPVKVDLNALHPAKSESSKDWAASTTDEGYCLALAKPAFFLDGAAVTIRYRLGKEKSRDLLQILKDGHLLAEFDKDIGRPFEVFPVEFFDFDGNGLMDFRLIFLTGGCAGNANNARVSYFFQHEGEWKLVSYFIRDPSYAWECDLDGDGKYELLKGHHQDKRKPGYRDKAAGKWVAEVFRKYLVINAYSVGEKGLALCNSKSRSLPMILSFSGDDPFDVSHDPQFMEYNQFKQPADCIFLVAKTLPQ